MGSDGAVILAGFLGLAGILGLAGHPCGSIRSASGHAAAWLAGLPRRTGRRLFAMNDAEARWHDWQVTEVRGGLGRQYRDPRFSALGPAASSPPPDEAAA